MQVRLFVGLHAIAQIPEVLDAIDLASVDPNTGYWEDRKDDARQNHQDSHSRFAEVDVEVPDGVLEAALGVPSRGGENSLFSHP